MDHPVHTYKDTLTVVYDKKIIIIHFTWVVDRH